MKKALTICFGVAVIFLGLSPRAFTLTNADYFITTESTDSAGANAQSANYALHGSAVGEFGVASTGSITSAAYILKNGYVGQLYDVVKPTDIVSRMAHGSAGRFDITLPLTGTRGVECRSSASLGAGNYMMVFTFANNLTSVSSVSPSGGGVSSSSIGPNPNQYLVNLTGVRNQHYLTVTLNTVVDSDGGTGNVSGTMGVLIGDVNANGFVTNADVSLVKAQVAAGGSVDPLGSNFRNDINANGVLTNADVSLTKAQVAAGAQLPSPP